MDHEIGQRQVVELRLYDLLPAADDDAGCLPSRPALWLTAAFLGRVMCAAPGHWMPLLFFVPVLWALSPDRFTAWETSFLYYLCASSCLPHGAGAFFGQSCPKWQGILLWISSSLVLSLPWAAFWSRRRDLGDVMWRTCAVLVVVTVPPVGLFGWGSPLMSAGRLFPGWGFAGIVLLICTASYVSSREFDRSGRLCCISIFALLAVCYACSLFSPPPQSSAGAKWKGMDTQYGRPLSPSASYTACVERSLELCLRLLGTDTGCVILPETAAGVWNRGAASMWELLGEEFSASGRTIAVGAEEYGDDLMYDNTMRFLGKGGGAVYRQRFPVPVSMWLPWGGAYKARAHMTDDGLVEIGDTLAACLICYEDFIAFPVMMSMFMSPKKPDLILTMGNHWWSCGTHLPVIALKCVDAWSRLFGVPFVSAMNI